MRKKILAFVFAAAMVGSTLGFLMGAGGASAHSPTPGEPNCHGKTVSANAKGHGGVKQAAADHGFASVKDAQEFVRAAC